MNKIIRKIRKHLQRISKNNEINLKELYELERKGAIVIDVRSPQEYNENHIDGAISIPEYEIEKKANEILKNKEEIMITYCSTGQRSKKAKEKLEKMGYKKIYILVNTPTN